MPALDDDEFRAFLESPGVLLHLGVVRPDGRPLVVPVWYIFEEDALWFTPREKSEWFACLRADPRATLCIDEQPHPYHKVVVDGRAELVHDVGEDDAWRDRYRRIAKRYVPEEAAEAYVQNTIDQPRGLYRVRLADADSIRTWRMPVEGEAAMGIWASRYYVDGTRF